MYIMKLTMIHNLYPYLARPTKSIFSIPFLVDFEKYVYPLLDTSLIDLNKSE